MEDVLSGELLIDDSDDGVEAVSGWRSPKRAQLTEVAALLLSNKHVFDKTCNVADLIDSLEPFVDTIAQLTTVLSLGTVNHEAAMRTLAERAEIDKLHLYQVAQVITIHGASQQHAAPLLALAPAPAGLAGNAAAQKIKAQGGKARGMKIKRCSRCEAHARSNIFLTC
jgi:hypothetical protein